PGNVAARMVARVLRPEAGIHLRADGGRDWRVRWTTQGVEHDAATVGVGGRLSRPDLELIVPELQSPGGMERDEHRLEIAIEIEVGRPLTERELPCIESRRRARAQRHVNAVYDVHI